MEPFQDEKEQREKDMASKVRLERMAEDKAVYQESLIQERKQIFDKKLKEFEVIIFISNYWLLWINFVIACSTSKLHL